MAQRRMFSQRITNSARFQQMPSSAQALYFHLGMAADDDGVVEAFMVMRTTKAAEDDFRVLVAKKFVYPLNEEQVSYILDWNEHNLIRADRLTPSIHRELLVRVIPDVDVVSPRNRADRPLSVGRPVDDHGTAQVRLGQDSTLGESLRDSRGVDSHSKESESYRAVDLDGEGAPIAPSRKPDTRPEAEIKAVFDLFGPACYAMNRRNKTQRQAILGLLDAKPLATIKGAVAFAKDHATDQYCPKVATPYDLSAKFDKLLAYKQSHGL